MNVRKCMIVALKFAAPQKPTIDMARVEALHNEGKPKKEIAKALGGDYHKILALGLPNLPIRQPKPIDGDRAQALRAGGLSVKDIAREEGVDRNRIDALKLRAFCVDNCNCMVARTQASIHSSKAATTAASSRQSQGACLRLQEFVQPKQIGLERNQVAVRSVMDILSIVWSSQSGWQTGGRLAEQEEY